jgi:hypothetical protein
MKNYFMICGLFLANLCFSQFEVVDKKMDEIPASNEESTLQITDYINSNFNTVDDKTRAAFYWTASTISYDVENMLNQQPNQSPDDKINRTLKSKKGVCMHYAQIFFDIMNKLNIETVLVDGYTKDLNGKISSLSHVWCASKINNEWFLFDPTWGSGYVNDLKFTKKIDNKYYKATPKSFIDRHMPFDYLWQLSNKPINNQEFYESKLEATDKSLNFDFMKEINNLKNLSEFDTAKNRADRIQKNGLENKLIIEIVAFEKQKINNFNQKNDINKLEKVIADFNESNKLFSKFINFKNKQFKPFISDEVLKSDLQIPYDMLLKCIGDINSLNNINRENSVVVNNLKRAMTNAKTTYETNLKFVNDYLLKPNAEREKMFVKKVVVRN